MNRPKWSAWPAPAFLMMCLLLGGSVQWPLGTLMIQLAAVALLLWALTGQRETDVRGEGLAPVFLLIVAVVWGLVQMIPLPPALWTILPGREPIVEGYHQLGMDLPWASISLDPSATMNSLLTLMIPLAVYLAILRREAPSATILIGAILFATTVGAILGIIQVLDKTQRFYPYPYSDWSSASGLFANPNHMGLLLLVSIPLAVGLGVERWRSVPKRWIRFAILVQLGAVAIVLATVIPLNGSLAIALMGMPVLIASALIPNWGKKEHLRRAATLLLGLVVFVAIAGSYLFRARLEGMGQTGFATRLEIWRVAWKHVEASFPFGTGFGTFARYYPLGEDPNQVELTFINHAHNDYLELLMEGGLPMVILLCLFFAWWIKRARSDWLGKDHPELGRAATVASATILAHSFVDFPLRTPGIAALFGACLAMMVVAIRPVPVSSPRDLHKTRHVVVR